MKNLIFHIVELLTLLFISLIFQYTTYAQSSKLTFEHISTADGLSDTFVASILKVYQAFMWFATVNGLNLYDRYQFTVYTHDPDDARSLSNNSAIALYEDRDRNFLIR